MSDTSLEQFRSTLGDAIGTVRRTSLNVELSNKSPDKLLDAQLIQIGAIPAPSGAKPPRLTKLAQVDSVQQSIGQMATAIEADPSLLEPSVRYPDNSRVRIPGVSQ
jgi:hypothetical protein